MRTSPAILLALAALLPLTAADLVHPGLRTGRGDLDLIRQRVLAGQQPWKGAYDQMLAFTGYRDGKLGRTPSSLSFQPKPVARIDVGSYENPHTGQDEALTDGAAAYIHAIRWYVSGDVRHAQKTIEILDAWGRTLTTITGSNKELAGAWVCSQFCEAAEIVRSTYQAPDGAWTNFDGMLRNRFWPLLKGFKPSYNGNWDALITQAIFSMGVVLDDRAMYDHAKNYFLNGSGNGSLKNYIRTNGTTQETTRDQEHEQMGVHALANSAEIAWKQGDDLYAALGDRILVGAEGTAARCLSQGTAVARYPTWEIIHNHYVHRRGLAMPKTTQLIDQLGYSPQDWSRNTVALWPVMTHRQLGNNDGAVVPPSPPPATAPTVTLTSPADGATFASGVAVRLTATASDADGIAKVEFYRGSTLITTEVNAPYDWSWSGAPDGTHVITAKAYDKQGTATTSAAATITVGSGATPVPSALAVVADTFVRGGSYAAANYGAEPTLLAKADGSASYTRETWLRFDLSGLPETVGQARLELAVTGVGSDAGTTDFAVDLVADAADGWTESGLTWNGRSTATIGSAVLVRGTVAAGGVLTVDVTGHVLETLAADPSRRLTLRIRGVQAGANRWLAVASDEHASAAPPRLVLDPGTGAG